MKRTIALLTSSLIVFIAPVGLEAETSSYADRGNTWSGQQSNIRRLRVAESGHAHEENAGKADDHGTKDAHATKDAHSEKDGREEHGEGVKLSPEQMVEFGVKTASVGPGPIATTITRPAEIKFDENLVAHVVPRVSGIVEAVTIAEGDTVKEGQVIATLDSRELAEAKATYLAALERFSLAEENFERERTLQRKKITSAKAYSASKTKLAEARISVRTAEQKLHALGFDDQAVKAFAKSTDVNFTKYTMRAPLSGIVIERHLVRGESVKTNRKAFTIVDISSVWVDISIYPRDLPFVSDGQAVIIKTDGGMEVPGTIAFVSPNVSESTRTATARIVLNNSKIQLQPGLFVKAIISVSKKEALVRIPKSALQNQDGKQVAFVSEGGKFEARPVQLGQQDTTYVEVASGLKAGETVVVEGAFVIKSQMSKASFGDGHNH